MSDATTTENTAQAPAAAPKPEKVSMPTANGITQPRPGTEIARVWDTASKLSDTLGRPATRAEAREAMGDTINPATFATQYARWTKFYGISDAIKAHRGAQSAAKAAAAQELKDKAKADKDAKKAETVKRRADEKAERDAKKAAEKAAKEAERTAKSDADAQAKAAEQAKAETPTEPAPAKPKGGKKAAAAAESATA